MKLSKRMRRLLLCLMGEITLAIIICNINKIVPSDWSSIVIVFIKLFLIAAMFGLYVQIQENKKDEE